MFQLRPHLYFSLNLYAAVCETLRGCFCASLSPAHAHMCTPLVLYSRRHVEGITTFNRENVLGCNATRSARDGFQICCLLMCWRNEEWYNYTGIISQMKNELYCCVCVCVCVYNVFLGFFFYLSVIEMNFLLHTRLFSCV